MARMKSLLVAAAVLATASAAYPRTWTDSRGNQIEAEFVRVIEGDVVLSMGGRVLRVPLSNLSAEDQQYVRDMREGKRQLPAALRPLGKAGTLPPALKPLETSARDKDRPTRGNRASARPGPEPERTWTDVRGRTTRARFVNLTRGNVVLLKNGRQVAYPFARFSAADQDYIRAVLNARLEGRRARRSTSRETADEDEMDEDEPDEDEADEDEMDEDEPDEDEADEDEMDEDEPDEDEADEDEMDEDEPDEDEADEDEMDEDEPDEDEADEDEMDEDEPDEDEADEDEMEEDEPDEDQGDEGDDGGDD